MPGRDLGSGVSIGHKVRQCLFYVEGQIEHVDGVCRKRLPAGIGQHLVFPKRLVYPHGFVVIFQRHDHEGG